MIITERELLKKYKGTFVWNTLTFGIMVGACSVVALLAAGKIPLSTLGVSVITACSLVGCALGFHFTRLSCREAQEYEEETEQIMAWLNGKSKVPPPKDRRIQS